VPQWLQNWISSCKKAKRRTQCSPLFYTETLLKNRLFASYDTASVKPSGFSKKRKIILDKHAFHRYNKHVLFELPV